MELLNFDIALCASLQTFLEVTDAAWRAVHWKILEGRVNSLCCEKNPETAQENHVWSILCAGGAGRQRRRRGCTHSPIFIPRSPPRLAAFLQDNVLLTLYQLQVICIHWHIIIKGHDLFQLACGDWGCCWLRGEWLFQDLCG